MSAGSPGAGGPDPVVVLVHGAFRGAWCWERLISELAGRGVTATAVQLPYTSYDDDLATVRAAIDAADAPVVLVGHSLGGGLVCAAGDADNVVSLGYLCAMAAGMGLNADGWVTVDPAVAASTFFSNCAPADVEQAVARLRPASLSSMTGLPAGEPWRTKPAGYIITSEDRALPLEDQQAFAADLNGPTHTLDSSHSPFWNRPAEVAEIIAGWVTGARG